MSSNKQDIDIIDIILDIHKDMSTTKSDMAYIKADLREHMKRTAQMEVEVKYLHRQVNLAHGAVALITLAGVIAGIFKAFQ